MTFNPTKTQPALPAPRLPDPATAAAAADEEEHEALVQAMATVTADENDDAGGRGSDSSGGSSSSESSSEDEGDLLEELWPRETQAELKYEVSGGRCCGGGVVGWCGGVVNWAGRAHRFTPVEITHPASINQSIIYRSHGRPPLPPLL